jgi:hypothetical protein
MGLQFVCLHGIALMETFRCSKMEIAEVYHALYDTRPPPNQENKADIPTMVFVPFRLKVTLLEIPHG